MKFSCSNLAWNIDQESSCLDFLKHTNITAIEVAPTIIWPNWENATIKNAIAYATNLNNLGFEISAMQAIVYGLDFHSIFLKEDQEKLLNHLEFVSDLAGAMNINTVVFGAPKLRYTNLPFEVAIDSVGRFFEKIANLFHQNNSCFCIEPCTEKYGCNFVINTNQALQLIDFVNSDGFGLHIDLASMIESGDDISKIDTKMLQHFHISMPNLSEFYGDQSSLISALNFLQNNNYSKWCSVEMLNSKIPMLNRGPWEILKRFQL